MEALGGSKRDFLSVGGIRESPAMLKKQTPTIPRKPTTTTLPLKAMHTREERVIRVLHSGAGFMISNFFFSVDI